MKITELELENFKVFKKETLKFNKITLLTGANSAGKSTILNALASVTQGNDNSPFPFYFNANGENVSLGSYKDIISDGNTADKFSVGVSFKDGKELVKLKSKYRYASSGKQILVDELEVDTFTGSIHIKWNGQDEGYKIFRTLPDISVNAKELALKIISSMSDEKFNLSSEFLSDYISEISKSSSDWESIKPEKSSDILPYLESEVKYGNLLRSYKRVFDSLLDLTTYIGPIRPYPERQYFSKPVYGKVDSYGINTFQFLIDWYKSDKVKFKKVVSDLKYIKLAETFDADNIREDLVEFLVTPHGHKNKVNISDVGFGVSQILPVVVANTVQKKGSTLLVNQPEVHLHPSSQAQLANYFAKESENHNLIIETHSEYLINRFRLLVAKGLVKKEDISIIFISHDENEPKVSDILIENNGSISGAPKSFFDTYYADNKALVFASFDDEDDDE